MQKGQSEHTIPISHLHQVYCSTAFHKMMPLTELPLLAFNPMSWIISDRQEKHQGTHKKINKETGRGQISYN